MLPRAFNRSFLTSAIDHIVFEDAASEPFVGAALCRVCRTAQAWVLPLLYETVVLSTAADIRRFAGSLTEREVSGHVTAPSSPALYVRNLWIGPTSSGRDSQPLLSETSDWPQADTYKILQQCKFLRTFALINIPPAFWTPSCVPKSVEALWLGPSHARIDWKYLLCAPRLRQFVSIDTFLFDTEFAALLREASCIKEIRQYLRNPDAALHALGRVIDTPVDTTLEQVEVVCCAEELGSLSMFVEDDQDGTSYDVANHRLVLTIKSMLRDSKPDLLALVFGDWLATIGIRD